MTQPRAITTITIRPETRDRLAELGNKNTSFDELLVALLDMHEGFYGKNKLVTRREIQKQLATREQ